jgi:FkbM family methyltransferase
MEWVNPGDISIRHHWVPERRLTLHSYRHKGYWYHGSRREQATMRAFARLIRRGDLVVEIGGHIGYITIYLASLAGAAGRVHVFEPAEQNLSYLRPNVAGLENVSVVPAAVSDENGVAEFFVEHLTGQNNTLVRNYEVFERNAAKAFVRADYDVMKVETVRLDDYVARHGLRPDFVKVDIEGAELMATRGMLRCLAEHRPRLLIEITRNRRELFDVLGDLGYRPHSDDLVRIDDPASYSEPNVFFVHRHDVLDS